MVFIRKKKRKKERKKREREKEKKEREKKRERKKCSNISSRLLKLKSSLFVVVAFVVDAFVVVVHLSVNEA